MKNAFDGLISKLDKASEIISDLVLYQWNHQKSNVLEMLANAIYGT